MRPIVNYHASDCVLCIVNDSSSSFSGCFSSYYVHTGSNILTWWRWNMSFPEGSLAFVGIFFRRIGNFPTTHVSDVTLGVRIHRILCLLKSQSTESCRKTHGSRLQAKKWLKWNLHRRVSNEFHISSPAFLISRMSRCCYSRCGFLQVVLTSQCSHSSQSHTG